MSSSLLVWTARSTGIAADSGPGVTPLPVGIWSKSASSQIPTAADFAGVLEGPGLANCEDIPWTELRDSRAGRRCARSADVGRLGNDVRCSTRRYTRPADGRAQSPSLPTRRRVRSRRGASLCRPPSDPVRPRGKRPSSQYRRRGCPAPINTSGRVQIAPRMPSECEHARAFVVSSTFDGVLAARAASRSASRANRSSAMGRVVMKSRVGKPSKSAHAPPRSRYR